MSRPSSVKIQAFALAATTAMTAVSMTLAAVMLSARSQWQLYASKSAEKNIIEAASTAESQDFMHRLKKELTGLQGPNPQSAGILGETELFQKNPFRRVEIRGGVARTLVSGQPSDRAPLLFKQLEAQGAVGATGEQVNMPPDDTSLRNSIHIPALWVPSDSTLSTPAQTADWIEKNPQKIALGKDDPFYDIYCRSSLAAVSAFSESRRATSGPAPLGPSSNAPARGFGNVVAVQTRTFPVSAFTYLHMDPVEPATFTLGTPNFLSGNEFDLGRVYTPAKISMDSDSVIQAVGIVALDGMDTPQSQIEQKLDMSSSYEDAVTQGKLEEWKAELESKKTEKLSKKREEYLEKLQEEVYDTETGLDKKLARLLTNSGYAPDDAKVKIGEMARIWAKDRKSLQAKDLTKEIRSLLEERERKIAALELELVKKLSETESEYMALVSKARPTPTPRPTPPPDHSVEPGSDASNPKAGGRNSGRKVTLSRSGNAPSEQTPDEVVASLDNLNQTWGKERLGTLRGTLVSEDNGGTELLRNSAVREIGSLIGEMSKYVDCSLKFTLSAPDTLGRRHPVLAPGGIQLRPDTKKPLVVPSPWLREDSPAGPFYWVWDATNPYGMLVFDPSKLTFSPEVGSTRPFAIYIDATELGENWPLFIKTSTPTQGISIVSKGPVYILDNFETVSTEGAIPSMIVSPKVYATRTSLAGPTNLYSQVEATVVSASRDPTGLFYAKTWAEGSDFYPSSPSAVLVRGSAVTWQSNQEMPGMATYATPPSTEQRAAETLSASVVPSLAPVVAEVRVSAGAPSAGKVRFLR